MALSKGKHQSSRGLIAIITHGRRSIIARIIGWFTELFGICLRKIRALRLLR